MVVALQELQRRIAPNSPLTHQYPSAGGFGDDVRLAVQSATETIHTFLRKVLWGCGDTPAGQAAIREAYHRFSSRSANFLHTNCPLGPNTLSANPEEVILA